MALDEKTILVWSGSRLIEKARRCLGYAFMND